MTEGEKLLNKFMEDYSDSLLEDEKLDGVDKLGMVEILLSMYEKNIEVDKKPEINALDLHVSFYFIIPEFYIDENDEKKNYKELIVPEAKKLIMELVLLTVDEDEREEFKEEVLESAKFFCKVRNGVVYTREEQEERKLYKEQQIKKATLKLKDSYEEV